MRYLLEDSKADYSYLYYNGVPEIWKEAFSVFENSLKLYGLESYKFISHRAFKAFLWVNDIELSVFLDDTFYYFEFKRLINSTYFMKPPDIILTVMDSFGLSPQNVLEDLKESTKLFRDIVENKNKIDVCDLSDVSVDLSDNGKLILIPGQEIKKEGVYYYYPEKTYYDYDKLGYRRMILFPYKKKLYSVVYTPFGVLFLDYYKETKKIYEKYSKNIKLL